MFTPDAPPVPACDDPLILPPEALPADAEPVGIILADDRVIDFAPSSDASH